MKKRTTKNCRCCGKRKRLEKFYKNQTILDGRASYCIMCSKKKAKQYRKDNWIKYLATAKEYRRHNSESIAVYHKEYYSRPEVRKRQAAYLKEYFQKNKDKMSAYYKEYNKLHKELSNQRSKDYYYANRERILKRQREYIQKKRRDEKGKK